MIKKGDKFKCTEGDNKYYTENKIYASDKDDCITDNNGNIGHYWGSDLTNPDGVLRFVKIDDVCIDSINPKHYSFTIKGVPCDLFDIGNAMDLNKEQFTALRYFRKKENQIEYTKKAIKCLERLVERLEAEKND